MDIEFVRSRFIKHFDGSTGSVYASPGRIKKVQNMKGKRFGRTIQKISGKNNKR